MHKQPHHNLISRDSSERLIVFIHRNLISRGISDKLLVVLQHGELTSELQSLRIGPLQKCAAAEKISSTSTGAALDTEDPKTALIKLLVEHAASQGPIDMIRALLRAGGEDALTMIAEVLDHTIETMEQVTVASPRRARRSLREIIDRAERVFDSIDSQYCDGISRCADADVDSLSLLLAKAMDTTESADSSSVVTNVLDCLEHCGSAVLQSVSLLVDVESDAGQRVSALEVLRGLSEARLEVASSDECGAFDVVKGRLASSKAGVGAEVVSGSMVLFTLGCRNGVAACGSVDFIVLSYNLFARWYKSAAVSADGDVLAAGAALGALFTLCTELTGKTPSEQRGILAASAASGVKTMLGAASKAFNRQRVCEVFRDAMKAGILRHDDISLASGFCYVAFFSGYGDPGVLPAADEAGMFSVSLDLHRRIEPTPLPDEWWVSTCDVIDVTSTRLMSIWAQWALVKRLPSPSQAPWFNELLGHAIRIAKVNASAGLSGRDTMCCACVVHALSVVELAAKDESQHVLLDESGVAEALEYGIMHDYTDFIGSSVSASAAGAAVSFMGRNEGGKVLRREAVVAVLERVWGFFDPDAAVYMYDAPVRSLMVHFNRICIMVISDANKKHMVQFEPLLDMLLECLLLDPSNRRHGQDGCDALQEGSAGVLHELALYGPGASALRSHGGVLKTLHHLIEVGTKESKEHGRSALFELEEETRDALKAAAAAGGGGAGDGTAHATTARGYETI